MLPRTWRWVFFVALLSALAGYPAAAKPTIIYVNQNAPASSSGSGTSWANAARELSFVLSNSDLQPTADNPVEFWIAKGTYCPADPYSRDRTSSFVLRSHIRLIGGFKGNETDPSQRLYFGYPTVLSGDIGELHQANAITADNAEAPPPLDPADPALQDNCFNVVTGQGVTDVVLDGLVIANGCSVTNGVSDDYITGMVMPLDTNGDDALSGKTITPLDPTVSG